MITQESGHNGNYDRLRLDQIARYLGREARQSVQVFFHTGSEQQSGYAQLTPQQAKLLSDLQQDPLGRYLSHPEKELAPDIPLELLCRVPHDAGLFAWLSAEARNARYDVVRDRI